MTTQRLILRPICATVCLHRTILRFGACLALLLTGVGQSGAASPSWQPKSGSLMTRWSGKVNPNHPLPEYPRPQLVREKWVNLNGLWEYAVTGTNALQPVAFEGSILVPFPIESALSGVKRSLQPSERLWYRRAFRSPALTSGGRLLLHFGAVDWDTAVSVNGKMVGEHRGGYDSFTFDISDAVKSGDNELVVSVLDATGGTQAKGKQSLAAVSKPGGIWYTPCSGIWQTVWLETVPAAYIDTLRIVPDVDNSRVSVTVGMAGGSSAMPLKISVLEGRRVVASGEGRAGEPVSVQLASPRLWSPESPFLYDLRVQSGADSVRSYFGMRKIALGKDEQGITRPMLNNKFVFQSGPLDQGFWPDGIYTAPTDEALKFDVEMTKKLGFNMTRKHVKVEPDRWYYWCDKLGLLVWQDMPSGAAGRGGSRDRATGQATDGTPVSPEAARQHEAELKALVEQHINHPSIILWVVFNEGWGQYDTPRLVNWVKTLDPSRLADNASGWNDVKSGDVVDMHRYPGPGCPPPEPDRAAVLGEFGGLGLPVPGHMWVDRSWGYRNMSDQAALTRKYLDLWRGVAELKPNPGLSAAVYTQLTDVETESNGLLTYDRKVVKVDLAKAYAAVARGKFPPPPEIKVLVPTAQAEPVLWRYTTDKPAEGWFKPGFDASGWKEAPAGFGSPNMRNGQTRTPWRTSDIWLRRDVELPAGRPESPMFRILHDEDAEVYINGVLALKATGNNRDYDDLALTPDGRKALKSGKNTIAVHVTQTVAGQFIDLGLVDEVEPKAGKR